MYAYVVKRVLLMIPTLLGAAVLIFFLLRAIPGDVCETKMAGDGAYVDQQQIEMCREQLGISDPIYVQFGDFVYGMLTFDLGNSMYTGRSINSEISHRFELSLEIAILATLTSILIALPLGVISAVRQNTWIDYVVRLISISGIAIPSFWLGIMLILGILLITQWWTEYFYGVRQPWLPPITFVSIFEDPVRNLQQLIWPAIATGFRYSAVATRMTRAAMLEVLKEDYVRTARAKGIIEKIVVRRHALKNAMLPVVTIIGIEFAFLLGGLVVTEQVFNLNGLGKLFVESVTSADYSMTQALVMLVVAIFVFVNLMVDLAYAWLDPRIRYS